MVELFKALSEESRLRILSLLVNGELCVCEIEACLHMSQSNASRHLAALKKCGMLTSFKQAQWTYYQIDNRFKEENAELWSYLEKRVKLLPGYQEDKQERQECKAQDLCGSAKPY